MTSVAAPPLPQTSIGRKVLMAGSGVILLGYVVVHMIGNLKLYLGAGPLNDYGDFLRRMGEPVFPRSFVLWFLRLIIIAAFVVHIVTAVQLSLQSRAARRTRYVHPDRVQADPAAGTMRWGGLAIGLFVLFHLAHFTWGWVHPGYTFIRGDVYHNVVQGFDVWWITAIYLLAMIALALHIYHGTWSIFQTFGVDNERWNLVVRRTAATVAAIVFIGNSSLPLAVISGAVK